jgi:hypothetical protein
MLKSIKKSDGTRYSSVAEFREALMDELSRGHEVLPTTAECVGFNYKTGCPGHDDLTPREERDRGRCEAHA